MTDNYDYVPSYDEDGELRHHATAEPEFEAVRAHYLPNVSTVRVDPGEHLAGIKDAIDEHGTNTVIQLGEGEYVGSELPLDHGIELVGAGRNATTLKLEDGVDTDLVVTPDVDNRNCMQVRMQGIHFDGNKANNAAGNLVYGAFWQSRFVDCTFHSAPERAFWAAGSSATSTDDNQFIRCRFIQPEGKGLQCGVNKTNSPASGMQYIRACYFGHTGKSAVHLRGNAHHITGSKFYGNGEPEDAASVFIDRSSFVRFENNDIAVSDTNCTLVAVKAHQGIPIYNVHIKDNDFRNSFKDGVQVYADGDDVSAVQVHDNVFHSNYNGEGDAVDGIDAFGSATHTACSAKDNTFLNNFTGTTTNLPTGWTETGTITG